MLAKPKASCITSAASSARVFAYWIRPISEGQTMSVTRTTNPIARKSVRLLEADRVVSDRLAVFGMVKKSQRAVERSYKFSDDI